MAVVLLDTGAVVGFLQQSDAFHAAASREIRRVAHERLILSSITYAELLAGAKLGHHIEDAVRGFCRDLISDIVPVGRVIAERGAELRARYQWLRLPDALILATADVEPADQVIGGDAQWSKVRGIGPGLLRLRA